MSSTSDSFLFESYDAKTINTARRIHIRRLYDILQLCVHRNDRLRARRAWTILVRCKEISWMSMWKMSVLLLGSSHHDDIFECNRERLEYLRAIMMQNPEESEPIVIELVLRLILSGREKQALDDLDWRLPSFPYQDNPVLHTYAGLVCLYLSLTFSETSGGPKAVVYDAARLREAQDHLERAIALDKDNTVAHAFLKKMDQLLHSTSHAELKTPEGSDEELMNEGDKEDQGRHKRSRA